MIEPDEVIMQIDLRHLTKAEGEDNPEWPVIDHLVECLPQVDGKPFLSAFVLTHPDKDHIPGFEQLLESVTIGELWHTPKVFRDLEDNETLCDDAIAFRNEAHRRRKVILEAGGKADSGDRLRVIGHDDLLSEDDYVNLPEECKSRPGELVTFVNGEDVSGSFEAFIHAPFKEDQTTSASKSPSVGFVASCMERSSLPAPPISLSRNCLGEFDGEKSSGQLIVFTMSSVRWRMLTVRLSMISCSRPWWKSRSRVF